MGVILFCFVFIAIFCGIETALFLFGFAFVVGFAWGTYRFFKGRKRNLSGD